MNVLRNIDAKSERRKWERMTQWQKAVTFVKQQKFWLLTWLFVPVAFPNWCIYNGYVVAFDRVFETGVNRRVSLAAQRGHVPSILCGASLWLNVYWLITRFL